MNRGDIKKTVMLLFCLAVANSGNAWDAECKGYLESYHAVILHDDYSWLASKTGLRLETTIREQQAEMTVRLNARQDRLSDEKSTIQIREAYMDYLEDEWDIRIGRQIIIWGKADGLIITDIISPKDQSDFITREFADMRMAVDAVKIQKHFEFIRIAGIWISGFTPSILPEPGSQWACRMKVPDTIQLQLLDSIPPENKVENSELGLRVTMNTSWMDASWYGYYGWQDEPLQHRSITQTGDPLQISVIPEFYRRQMTGLDAAKPWGNLVWRFESGFFINEPLLGKVMTDETVYTHHCLKTLLGVDWSPGNDWAISSQIVNEWILNFNNALEKEEQDWMVTLSLSKKLIDQLLEISVSGFCGLEFEEGYIQIYADYALTDALHVALGVNGIFGKSGYMAQIDKNDHGWVQCKYSF
ncbi:hypothetical protein K8S19_01440 [bacterium]|nr:hypothetical protein [bacterium]